MKKNSQAQGDHFIISYELLHVLYWLLKYEEVELSKLINKSFVKGIKETTKNIDSVSELCLSEEMQNSIVDFFTFMEQEILDITDQKSTKFMNKDIIKDIARFDPKQVDYSTIKETISKNAQTLHFKKYNSKNRTNFLKELLRQWKPQKEKCKKTLIN